MTRIQLINGRQARMIEATISLPAEELARLLSANITDRHAAMVQQHGEACTKTTAAKILSCSTQTVTAMLRDGRIKAACGGERVELTYKEYELLRLFLSHPGTAFTRAKLMELVWGMDYCGESRTVDMHIRTLRQKLGKAGAHITTVRGVGYRWEETI